MEPLLSAGTMPSYAPMEPKAVGRGTKISNPPPPLIPVNLNYTAARVAVKHTYGNVLYT
jgi:hypothetical protein